MKNKGVGSRSKMLSILPEVDDHTEFVWEIGDWVPKPPHLMLDGRTSEAERSGKRRDGGVATPGEEGAGATGSERTRWDPRPTTTKESMEMSEHDIKNIEDLRNAMETMRKFRDDILNALNSLEEVTHSHLTEFKTMRMDLTDPFGENSIACETPPEMRLR